MRPRREVLLTTFADPSTFPSVLETPVVETPEPEITAAPAAPVATFADLGLPAEIVRVLSREGITTPFEIQSATVPDAMAGRDVLGRGQTGSGKTLAFGLPVLARTAPRRAVISTPANAATSPLNVKMVIFVRATATPE